MSILSGSNKAFATLPAAANARVPTTAEYQDPSGITAAANMTDRILLIEDDAHIGEMLQHALTREGYETQWVGEGEPALRVASASTPDLILLDLKLPDIDGLEVCRRLRAEFEALPIIILTARSEEIDVVIGLDAGA